MPKRRNSILVAFKSGLHFGPLERSGRPGAHDWQQSYKPLYQRNCTYQALLRSSMPRSPGDRVSGHVITLIHFNHVIKKLQVLLSHADQSGSSLFYALNFEKYEVAHLHRIRLLG